MTLTHTCERKTGKGCTGIVSFTITETYPSAERAEPINWRTFSKYPFSTVIRYCG